MSSNYKSIIDAVRTTGLSAERIKSYNSMGGVRSIKKESNHTTLVDVTDLQAKYSEHRAFDASEIAPDSIKVFMTMLDMLYEYFPIDNLPMGTFAKFESDFVAFMEKHAIIIAANKKAKK